MKLKLLLLCFIACLLGGQAATQNPCDLTTGLTGYFPFKGNAHDASLTAINGVGYNLSPTGGHDGVAKSAFHFNGNSSWIDCSTDNRGVNDEVTVCAWVRTTNTTTAQWVAGKYRYEEDKGYGMVIDGSSSNIGQVGFGGRDGTSGTGVGHQSGWSTKKVNDGNWHCLVGMAANQSWEIYVDGTLENSMPGSTIGGMATSSSVPFTIGFQIPASPVWMNGDIDNVRVYNRQLTQSEIECYCYTAPCETLLASGLAGHFPLNGNADDISSNNIDGTLYGTTPTFGHGGNGNSALNFNGSSDWIDCGTDNRGVTDEVAVCAWVRTTNTTTAQWVAGKYRYEEDKGYGMVIDGSSSNIGQVGFGGRDGTSGTGVGHQSGWSTKKVNDGNWHCLVGMAANQSWEIYVDGALENSMPGSTIGGMATSSSVPFTIGFQIPASPVWMDGDIDGVRLYNRRLTPYEIECYCSTGTVSTENQLLPTDGFRIFPNPNPGAFTVELPQPATPGMALRIVDLTGRLVLEINAEAGSAQQTVEAGSLSNGLYFLQVVSSGKVVAVEKFVKQ